MISLPKKKISFEEAMEKLKEYSEKIKSPEISLEDSIQCYEEGMKYYEICRSTLEFAKQKIETFAVEESM